ncbi:PHD-finger domain-containing protein [Sarocladium implicatum]|nr:PHD-finger domain-containing protein [Sarocladium implicatum]
MAPPSPRRSSRARPTNSQSNQSSVSSSTTGRSERNTRSLNKPTSGKSTPSASLSSEPPDDFEETLMTRRRKRGLEDEPERLPGGEDFDMATNDELQDEEDEAVRCICGAEDYPGRPPVEGPDAEFFAGIELTEDVTGFFVQCDVCKVWQHGACVGIFSAESSPDEYFCEQCRKDLHKIHTASNGQKYSKFLPLHRASRNTSRATSLVKEGTRSPRSGSKNARANAAAQLGKRRSTMNSRDAAYDDEQLRRAIEASKEDNSVDEDGPIRRPKRGRSDSEDGSTNVKRQRTSSRSVSPAAEGGEVAAHDDSEDESSARNGNKKTRNSRPQRDRTEREERERQRQEAADKRKGRAERRRADDSDPSDEVPLAAKPIKTSVEPPHPVDSPDTTARPTPDTPPPVPAVVASSHKRGARSNHKKTKGKNQYTKDRDLDHDNSPDRSMSRDIVKAAEDSASAPQSKSTGDHKHGAKSKSSLPNKMSMLDMKRRVAAIMDFISRTQVDLATEELPSRSSNNSSAAATPAKKDAPPATNGQSQGLSDAAANSEAESSNKDFKDLSCMEMMDVLTRDMVKWQNQYV